MYTEQLTKEQIKAFYDTHPIITVDEEGNEKPFKYQLCVNGKYYNFDNEKYGYTMFLKDFTCSIGWIKGPVKQQIINNYQRYMSELFEDYASDLYDHEQSKESNATL